MPKLTVDILQNELILIDHHLGDIEKAVKDGDNGYALKGLKDAKEVVQRLSAYLPQMAAKELGRMEESKNKRPTALHMTSKQRRKAGKLNESAGAIPVPAWAKYRSVDEIIECLSFGDMRKQVERELMAACPHAYDDLPPATQDPEVPFEYPDQLSAAQEAAGTTLDVHWNKLSQPVQQAIIAAYNRECGLG